MTKLWVIVLLPVLTGAAARLHSERSRTLATPSAAMLASSAPFRDGLYLGALTARQGAPVHVASGRWASAVNRDLFTAGYQQGYREFQVEKMSVSQQAR